jgi:hypothetical protein
MRVNDKPTKGVKMDKLLESIKPKLTDEENSQLLSLINKQVVALGTDHVFALRDKRGEIVAFKQRVRLAESDGTLVKIKKTYSVSAQGYEVLSEASGTCVMTPEKLFVDGEMRSNPWVCRDDHHRIVTVYARAIAFRFSSKGLPIVSDWLTTYDSPNYRLIDLLAKAKETPRVFRLLPRDMQPEEEFTTGGLRIPRTWARYYFDPACDLWVDTSAPEVLDWHSQIINREKKSLDYAQTFARRNAVKHLLGIHKAPEGCNGVWDLAVLCWRPVDGSILKWDMTRYIETRNRVQHLSSGGSFELTEVIQGQEEIGTSEEDDTIEADEPDSPEPVPAAVNGAAAEPQGEAAKQPPPVEAPAEKPPASPGKRKAKPKPEGSEEARAKLSNLLGFKSFYRSEWAAALKASGLPDNWAPDVNDEPAMDRMLEAMSRAMDATLGGE